MTCPFKNSKWQPKFIRNTSSFCSWMEVIFRENSCHHNRLSNSNLTNEKKKMLSTLLIKIFIGKLECFRNTLSWFRFVYHSAIIICDFFFRTQSIIYIKAKRCWIMMNQNFVNKHHWKQSHIYKNMNYHRATRSITSYHTATTIQTHTTNTTTAATTINTTTTII